MKRRSLFIEAAAVAIITSSLVALASISIKKSLEQQKLAEQRRLQKIAVTMIERANHVKDDLIIQEVLYSLGKAPGILLACVIGRDEKILAHTQPSELGQPYHRTSFPVTSCPLYEGQTHWGTLLLALSDQRWHAAWLHHTLLLGLGGIFFWLAWVARLLFWVQRAEGFHQNQSELKNLLDEQQLKQRRDNERYSQARAQWLSYLQIAVDHVAEGLLLLDHKQRIAAINHAAMEQLSLKGSPASLLGKSWQDIPSFEPYASLLERSLSLPGQTIETPGPEGRPILKFKTDPDCLGGTWISFL